MFSRLPFISRVKIGKVVGINIGLAIRVRDFGSLIFNAREFS